ncbi:meiotic recombination protein REC8 homolog [Limanda limanda]|uniref:meiotic recombination protein REC8 homolog n=1 Tax=Limanda limanda TaxID=27771 RepID=UPI0029C665E3|nr:meiotic recombination protein REC8 homolog [Limanda limanda]
MFYYPAVLTHQTGCFSTIWLVATKGIRVTRRDFLKVNVKSTCDDIMNYVLQLVPPPRPGLPRPRFSLYLSSQLQYGVIKVYHRQCAILLEEVHTIVGKLVKHKKSKEIDQEEQNRQALLLPDGLSLMEEAEGALDPLFGVMIMQEAMPSPGALMQIGEDAAQDIGMTSSPDSITLREPAPRFIPIPEFEGVELADQDLDTVDLLMAEADHFPEGVLQPTVLSGEEPTLLPKEEPAVSEERPGPPRGHITPVSGPVLPPPPPSSRVKGARSRWRFQEVPPPEVKRRRRKRQLVFFDPETQIPQGALQQQIDNPLIETRRAPRPTPSSLETRSAADLLNNPCTFLPEEVLSLWQQAAYITPISGSDLQVGERGPDSTDSEKERDREMVEVSEREEERLELSRREVQRDLEEQENDISGLGTLSLEGSDQRERSREISPMQTSEKEGSIVSRSVSVLQDIPEVVDEFLERSAAESPGLLPDEDESAPVLFQSLLPPEADRRTVSIIFQKLLGIASARKVRVKQRKPYDDIWITPGSNYRDVLQTL